MILLLFDMDGTLTPSRNKITASIKEQLHYFKSFNFIKLGVVSGSDLIKIKEQLGEDVLEVFDYVCTENGLVTYTLGELTHTNSMVEFLGENVYQKIVNGFLKILSTIELNLKRGNFLELRTGMLNVCPIGRSCSQKERDDFEQFDKTHKIRETIVNQMNQYLTSIDLEDILQMSIGGQISIDVFPKGWNKTYCLQHFTTSTELKVHFFGDRIFPGGNDYEIGIDSRVKAHSVSGPDDTVRIVNEIIKEQMK
jgi:phosphomannomutase